LSDKRLINVGIHRIAFAGYRKERKGRKDSVAWLCVLCELCGE